MATTHSKVIKAKSASHHIIECDVDDLWVGSIEEVPAGFLRRADLVQMWKVKDRMVGYRLDELYKVGKVIAKKFYIKRRDGKPGPVTHYKLL